MSPEILSISNLAVHEGKLKKIHYRNWSLTFFFSVDCPFCKDLYPIFNSLSQQFSEIKFDYLNVNTERFKSLNKKLKYPLTFVPIIFLFHDEDFVASFQQTDEINMKNNFIQLRNFILQHITKKNNQNEIPAYSLGIPGNQSSKKTCKIFNEAYASLK